MANKTSRNTIIISPEDALNMGIIQGHTNEIFINDQLVTIDWPNCNKVDSFLCNEALKEKIALDTAHNQLAKQYYKLTSNKYENFRRIIDLDILKPKTVPNINKLNNLKNHETSYQSNFILKSDKTISNLKNKHIQDEFNNFFTTQQTSKPHHPQNHQPHTTKQKDLEPIIEEFFDMNPIRKMSVDYSILGEKFLKLFEVAPHDQFPSLFKEVNNKLVALDKQPYVEVFYKLNK